MESIQFKVIKSSKQYKDYCNMLENLVMMEKKSKLQQDTIELLTVLIEKWDQKHNTFSDADPVELLVYLIKTNNLKAVDLAKQLDVSKSLISDILHYRRGLSRDIIRKLATRFKVSQELFNKPYKLISPVNSHLKDASVMNTKKTLSRAV
ncbi:transcriptional regulator [Dinghuibacter sp.]|jgi:HTH-type transcriptional regulator/antitoxin HigA|uniref:helix-turn-helix domain-containing protein n=1 Tax=Dinghuibacter sp. TaxID=2024697 RepID=UPI002D80F5BC|nr:transcriptional regulator [Dinghuibacter sp.]